MKKITDQLVEGGKAPQVWPHMHHSLACMPVA